MPHVLGILTERLLLRPVELGDAPATAALMTPAIASHLTTWPRRLNVTETMRRIADSRRKAAEEHWIDWGIFLKQDLMQVGWVGLGRDELDPQILSVGYWIGEAFQRQRYATEAVTMIVDKAPEFFGGAVIEAMTLPNNVPSICLLRRLGFHDLGRQRRYAPARQRSEEFSRFLYDGQPAFTEPQRLTGT
jgi:RimJ/RimL family protein N-acetyltransferase